MQYIATNIQRYTTIYTDIISQYQIITNTNTNTNIKTQHIYKYKLISERWQVLAQFQRRSSSVCFYFYFKINWWLGWLVAGLVGGWVHYITFTWRQCMFQNYALLVVATTILTTITWTLLKVSGPTPPTSKENSCQTYARSWKAL